MNKLTVCFGGNMSAISLGIQLWSRSQWSHVAIVLPDGNVIESVGGIGVVSSTLDSFKSRYQWWVVGQMLCEDSDKAHALALQYVEQCVGYDERLTFGQILGLYLDDPDKLNCSEKVGTVCGLYRADVICRLRPADLWRHCKWVTESYSAFPRFRPVVPLTDFGARHGV